MECSISGSPRKKDCWIYYWIYIGVSIFVSRCNGVDYTCDTFPDYAAYLEQWWRLGPTISSRLYPYGTTYCDTEVTREPVGFDAGIKFDIPFYGKLYKGIWISPSGFLALTKSRPASAVHFIWMNTLPNPMYPNQGTQDPPMIAPFYAETDMLRVPGSAAIYHRKLDLAEPQNDNQRRIVQGLLWDISTEIRAAVVGADQFQATHGIIVTWHQITFLGNDCMDKCARNTYQAAVMTDGVDSYVVFNYQNITWVGGGANQNCDRMTGTASGTHPNCKPAHAGLNAGEGRKFHALPYSNQNSLANIDQGGGAGSNVTGRFYYKVSGDTVRRGGCTNDTSIAGTKWQTEIFPKSGVMLGGAAINISGPCFKTPEALKCRFDGHIVDAIYVNNIMRVMCIVPFLASVGPIKVAVSTNGGNTFEFETDYVVVTADHVTPDITIKRQNADWLSPGQMELTWSPTKLTPRPSDRVDVRLYGYREDSGSGSYVAVWKELHVFADDYSNTGTYTFTPDGHFLCDYQAEGKLCTQFDVGAFQINIEFPGQDPTNPRRIWSQVFPLGWYVKDAMNKDQGSDWVSYKCEVWYNANKDEGWYQDIERCPCRSSQAHIDFGRFQPDPQCIRGATSTTNCERHLEASNCVLSVYSSLQGSGTQCCYDNQGNLMYSGDTQYGSRSQRSHVWGSFPYKAPPRVPTMSHWQRDLAGFYYCCQWQTDPADCYRSFLDIRETVDCDNYQVSGQAMAYGDPHFLTFDKVSYTFNGYGEFWLMKASQVTVHNEIIDFKLHGRFEQPANQSWGSVKGTFMTAVGMQLNAGQKVVIELNRGGIQKKLLIYINSYLLDLTQYDLRRQELQNFIIINNDPVDNTAATNFTVVYRCGVGINVVYKNDLLHLVLSVPPEFKGNTQGLLGTWNDNAADDFTPSTPGGPIINPDETEKIHYSFGMTWVVTSVESCFEYIYRGQMHHPYYNRPSFIPNFVPTLPSNNTDVTEDMVNALCGGNKPCTFDYKTTLSSAIASDSLQIQQWDAQRRQMGKHVTTCGWLEIPYTIKSKPFSYLSGSTITITGCISGFTLEGPTEYVCQDLGDGLALWSPEITTKCRGPDDPLSTAGILIIAIPIAIVLVLLIIGIIVIVLVCRKKKKRKREATAKQALVDSLANTSVPEGQLSSTPATPKLKKKYAELAAPVPGLATPEKKKKPARPAVVAADANSIHSSIDLKNNYDNKQNTSDESGNTSSGNHVSWDHQDGGQIEKMSDTGPVKVSTLKSRVSMDPSPHASPKVKKKRPYQYPHESRDNSSESQSGQDISSIHFRPQQEPVATYKPRDIHSYTKGHNIPTSDTQTSSYYQRKYGRYNYN